MGQRYLALRQELQEAEQEYTQNIRHEARRFADETRAEFAEGLQYHQTALAQAESLLAAERVHHRDALQEQSTRWQDAFTMVTQCAEEARREEAAKEEDATVVTRTINEWVQTTALALNT